MNITLNEIERWANSSELDQHFEQLFEVHQEFGDVILATCDDETLLRFAANRSSLRREFFAMGLVERLVHSLYNFHGLPFAFSRFAGLIPFEDYKTQEIDRLKRVYAGCKIVEAMRNSAQEEIKNIADLILDYRHDRLLQAKNIATTTKLLQLLHHQIQVSFRPGVASYTRRLCTYCNDGFKSWVQSGVEIDPTRCPFCLLKLEYPQKTGKNAS